MLPSLKAAFTLLSLLQLVSGRAVAPSHQQALKEVILLIQELTSRVQVPCNDTRVAQIPFTDQKLPEQELLCQAAVALTKVTRCKETYEPLIMNLKLLHGKKSCVLSDDSEIYLRHFLPALGNFTQGMFRRRGWAAHITFRQGSYHHHHHHSSQTSGTALCMVGTHHPWRPWMQSHSQSMLPCLLSRAQHSSPLANPSPRPFCVITGHQTIQRPRAVGVQPKQAMSILVQLLLTLLVLSACLGDVVAHTLRSRTLKETMELLERLQQEVSCDKMHVINIFADHKRGNNTEIFCKAARITQEVKSCHKDLEGIYYNLLNLVSHEVRHTSFLTTLFPFQKPCPAAPGNTISLKNFLEELDHVLQEEFKCKN
ncbi:unnamed protein product [Coccothraustes coccothraustes]